MKKVVLVCLTALMGMTLSACGSSSSQKSTTSSNSSSKATKVVKHHKKANSEKKQSQSSTNSQQSSLQNANSQNPNTQQNVQSSNNQQQGTQTGITKSQSEINRERGYDPNGAPLLPGQDHAAGSNPDGSPDAWVQGQIDWAIQNGYMNPDGTNTPKGQAAEDEVERDSQPGMP
ncbi:hypothetical protein [Limosilactobacillus reuteri]|uniref:hypothetical protein n=1 Tax=Limosilactobacillus reuteri TaxID=1598 RepID=UPI001E40886F|nr:hypothetical protein [Limosilactobacillus reuteri]MCC4369378.1 hypothetical protein [Limosilactobacillus reuteri]